VGCFSGDLPERRPGSVMKMLFVGRLVPYKCCDVVVEAIAGSRILRSHTLTIVGDGPERPRLQEAVTRNGLAEQVGFRGWLPHAQVQGLMSDHDVFAFPTVRELGAGVVLEAMSRGMACVVADYGAPRQYAAEDRGLRVDFTDRRTLVTGTRLALERLAVDGEERLRLGVRAHTYAQRHHTWEERARRVEELYGWVLGRKVAPPDFMS
jgi:glycosyltransferase involved in cell wall biosynthesis